MTRLKGKLLSIRSEVVQTLTQDRCTVCTEHTLSSEIILHAPDKNSEVTWVMWNLISVRLEIVLVSVQDRCTVCAEHTTGTEIVLDAHDETAR
jgi:hypothetical protein